MRFRFAGLVLVVAAWTSSFAHAGAITTLFNTGVDATGAVLPDGTPGDPHYQMIGFPSGATTALKVATSASNFPIGPWLADNTRSRWIGPNETALTGPVGDFTYRTTFDLSGMDAASATISGLWSTDDLGLDILLNGVSLGLTNTVSFVAFTPFEITTGFLAGINTLDFVLNNKEGPTGLRVEMTGTANANTNAIPEPASLALTAVALGSLMLVRRRRR